MLDKLHSKYDSGSGEEAQVGDLVIVTRVKTDSESDGLCGQLIGFYDSYKQMAIIILERPNSRGETAVTWPTVCLSKIGNDVPVDLSTVRNWKQESFLYRDMTK